MTDLPEGVVQHEEVLDISGPMPGPIECAAESGGFCDCGAEQRAREVGAVWAEYFALLLRPTDHPFPAQDYTLGRRASCEILLNLAEQLRARE